MSISADGSGAWCVDAIEVAAPLELALAAARLASHEAAARLRPGRSQHRALHTLQV
ncbi:MAG: hypothetical protein SH850_26495 [Planctomycetaceae bacterium]|nr:hypothetical protein [Planctomycetaceae bacterium]